MNDAAGTGLNESVSCQWTQVSPLLTLVQHNVVVDTYPVLVMQSNKRQTKPQSLTRVIDHGASNIKVLRIVLIEKVTADVRNVHASITLASNINLPVLQPKSANKATTRVSNNPFPNIQNSKTHFFQNPANCSATSSSLVAVGIPLLNPVPTGCSTQTTFVRLFHAQSFLTGLKVPYCQMKGPFSWRRPSRELHPGPPFNQIRISSLASTLAEGKNQKYNSLAFFWFEMGIKPA